MAPKFLMMSRVRLGVYVARRRPARHNVYKRFYRPALVAAGLDPPLNFHTLRHSAASVAGSSTYAGESAKVVQTLLGLSSQQVTTEVYSHLFGDELKRLGDSLDRVFAYAGQT